MAIDKLRLLRNKRSINFNDQLFLNQPTIGEIDELLDEDGISEYYNGLWLLCSCAYDMPSILYDKMKKDYRKVSDWEFFRMMAPSVSPNILSMCLKEKDGSGFSFYGFGEYEREIDGKVDKVLYRPEIEDEENGITIPPFMFDENLYNSMIPYLRASIGFVHKFPEHYRNANKATAQVICDEDRKDRLNAEKKKDESSIFDMIISCVNTEECSYNYETIWNMTFFQLFKSFQQIQGKKAAMALLQGSCSGFVDTSKIPKEDMSWTYSEDKYKPKGKKLFNNKTKN